MPPWTAVEADADVVCRLHQRLSDVYPVTDIDVVLVGIFHQVRAWRVVCGCLCAVARTRTRMCMCMCMCVCMCMCMCMCVPAWC
jgi:hypothetical protein